MKVPSAALAFWKCGGSILYHEKEMKIITETGSQSAV
jgi:hypothetical protein